LQFPAQDVLRKKNTQKSTSWKIITNEHPYNEAGVATNHDNINEMTAKKKKEL